MPRINVPTPKAIPYTAHIDMQISDINYGRHLADDAVLRLYHETHIRWLATLSFTELDAGDAGLIMADAAVQYLAQAHHDDALQIRMGVEEASEGGFVLLYRVVRIQDGKTVARVRTGMVCFDYTTQRICHLPQALRTILEAI